MRAALRLPALALAPALAWLAVAPVAHAQTHDPRLVWDTLETPHFRVHHYRQLRAEAERVAAIGEGIFTRVTALMGHAPDGRTEVVLTDTTDDANGSATALPYDAVHLYVTAPGDREALGDYDDWLQTLVTHEFTHVTHLSNIRGIPAAVNAITGRLLAPNQAMPRWMTEGFAVWSESRNTTAGRLRSTQWEMQLRADVLANHTVSLDQLGVGPERWPHGDIVYLYGSFFVQWLVEHHGSDAPARIARATSAQLVPYLLDTTAFEVLGAHYTELYPEFLASARERFRLQISRVESRGVREGERLTFHGEDCAYPRFLPDGRTLAYEVDDADSHAQLRTLRFADDGTVTAHDGAWVGALDGFAIHGDDVIVSDVGYARDLYTWRDLFSWRVHTNANGRMERRESVRITTAVRAREPDVSPDGTAVAFTSNHHGTSALVEMDLATRAIRPLTVVEPRAQFFTPRYSPDGRALVVSHTAPGGDRDIWWIDRATGRVRALTSDRAVDRNPVFTPDGGTVIFSSDRSGIANLYAFNLETGSLRQVTNVRTGAFQPAVSPDGRTLVYVGYTTDGYDLYRLPYDPATWLDAPPSPLRTGTHIPTPAVTTTRRPYDPWPTLRPYSWSAQLGNDGYGPVLSLVTQGGDVVGNHSFIVRGGIGLGHGDATFDAAYSYQRLFPTMTVHAYRFTRAASWPVGGAQRTYTEERWGGDASVTFTYPWLFQRTSFTFAYEAQYIGAVGGLPFGAYINPGEPGSAPPFHGWNNGLRASVQFARTQRYRYDVGTRSGYQLFATVRTGTPFLANYRNELELSGGGALFVPLPWGPPRRPHVLALRGAAGFGFVDRVGFAPFSVGGLPQYPLLDFITALATMSTVSGVALRGYAPVARAGRNYYLFNAEYRFLVAQVDAGPGTWPIYLRRLYCTVFADVGDAFSGAFDPRRVAVGTGGELLADVVLGYSLPVTVRIGFAQGLTGSDARTQGYAVLGTPF